MSNIYDLSVERADGTMYSLAENKGKVMIIVNTATRCGFTPQYNELEDMYEKFHDKGLEIIDVPCNQFGEQAPGTNEEISQFCSLNYKTKFPQMKKGDVNGENELPLFKYLKENSKINKSIADKLLKLLSKTSKKPNDIIWNFTKFIVDREGNVVARFEPTVKMEEVEKCVASLIG